MKKKVNKWIYWLPRALSIIFILFIALFSLDVFGQGYGFLETFAAFLVHNIPTFILAILTWISWKYELIGAIAFWLVGLAYLIFAIKKAFADLPFYLAFSWSLILVLPTFIIGFLWYLNWKKSRE